MRVKSTLAYALTAVFNESSKVLACGRFHPLLKPPSSYSVAFKATASTAARPRMHSSLEALRVRVVRKADDDDDDDDDDDSFEVDLKLEVRRLVVRNASSTAARLGRSMCESKAYLRNESCCFPWAPPVPCPRKRESETMPPRHRLP